MLKFLKRLFCRHHWEALETNHYGDSGSLYFIETRICKKCGKIETDICHLRGRV